jgi:glycosyltransferase involved in cell wall biosynthesis
MTFSEDRSEDAPLRVLHVLRKDHALHHGGDVVQLKETVGALCRLGVEAVAATIEDAPEKVDVVHVYNVQLPGELIATVHEARLRWPRARFVLSPIFAQTSLAALKTGSTITARKAVRARIGDVVRSVQLRSTIRSVDAVIANSRGELAHVRRWFRVRSGAVALNGLTIARWPKRAGPPDRASMVAKLGLHPDTSMLIACVGRLEPLKNQLTLVRTVDRLPDTAVVFAGPDGDPAYSAAVRKAAAKRPARVAFTGALSQPDVADLLTRCDVHVLPSFRESFGLVTLEAAASGCELVAARSSWTREWLGDGAAYADVSSPSSIASALFNVRNRPRQPGLRTFVERFTWDTTAHATLECYRSVCAARVDGTAR